MFKYILLIAFSWQLYALQITVSTGREHSESYSILHIESSYPFMCVSKDNQTKNVSDVICAFNKKPKHTFKNISNNYFSIISKIEDNIFFIIIKPKYQIFVQPISFNLLTDSTVFKTKIQIAKKWLIVGYKASLPYIGKKVYNGLNLPVTFFNMKPAYIGGLDLSGKPIHIKQLKSIKFYISIKQAYADKKYTKALSLVDNALQQRPYSMFGSLYLYDKIKILYTLGSYSKLIAASQNFLRQYSGDEHTAEILLLTANSHHALKQSAKAKYFYNRLLSEHEHSKYAKLALIKIGDILLSHNKKQQAIDKYVEALDTASNLDVASLAAYKIALFSFKDKMPKAAIGYITKILSANPFFFAHNNKAALKISLALAKYKKYKLALKITNIALNTVKQSSALYPLFLQNKGVWLAKIGEKDKAVKVFNLYISKFPNTKDIAFIKEAKYALFFNDKELNATQRLKHYSYLIKKYNGQNIAKEALDKKVHLLYKTKQYTTVLSLNLKGFTKIVDSSAEALLQQMIANNHCYDAMKIYKQYKIMINSQTAPGTYQCAMQTLSYKTAQQIANQFIDSKDISKRMQWMYYDALALYHLKHYHKVLQIGHDLTILMDHDTKSLYNDIYRVMFDSYAKLKDNANMLTTIKTIIARFGIHFKDISRYMQLVRLGVNLKDNNIIMIYGKYVYALQNQYKTYPHSPYIEFTLAQAYNDRNHLQKAVKVLQSLTHQTLTPLQKSRQEYLLGTIFQQEWKNKEARGAFEESIKADKTSPWALLSQDAIKLL